MFKFISLIFCCLFLFGCSLSPNKVLITDIKDKDKIQRSLNLTIISLKKLNSDSKGFSKPVQICVYLVEGSEWHPTTLREQSKCVEDEKIKKFSRFVISSNEYRDLFFELSHNINYLLVIDADFTNPSLNYKPFIFNIGKRNLNLSVHIGENNFL